MIVLDATNELLQMVLGTAVTTNELQWTADYSDWTPATPSLGPLNSDGVSNGVSDVDMVGSPGVSVQRLIKHLAIYNADTVAAQVTVKKDRAAGTERILCKFALQPGETLEYEDGVGFRVFTVSGGIKSTVVTSGTFLRSTVILNGTTSFITQPTTARVFIRAIAAGGGGGGVNTNAAGNGTVAGGGGAGGYFEKTLGVRGSETFTVAVGAGGLAGASGGGTGGTGGNTTFLAYGVTYTANGGVGGGFTATGVAAVFVLGGSGGSGANADVISVGASGGPGYLAAAGSAGVSGFGASSQLGGGGKGTNVTGQGSDAGGYGAGGAGSLSLASGAAQAGKAGANGILVIDEYT